mgnify:CR=1 FL=1
MATIAIIGALEKEIMQIKKELSDVCEAQEAGLTVVSGELDGLTIVATTAGMGTVNAAAATGSAGRSGSSRATFRGAPGATVSS